jgi:hypothetical protein
MRTISAEVFEDIAKNTHARALSVNASARILKRNKTA